MEIETRGPMEQKTSPIKPWVIWTLMTFVVCAAAAGVGFDIYRRAAGMRAATISAASVLAVRPGVRTKAVVRLEGPAGLNTYSGDLLESDDGVNYRETPDRIRVALSGDTAVAMGGASDIKRGAVVQVAGAMDGARTLHATQIVILSGYVRVPKRR